MIIQYNDGISKNNNLLYDATYEPSKFRTRYWVEINGKSQGTYNTNSDIKFKTSMIRSHLCN